MIPTASPAVWITGAGGLIGHALVQTAPHHAPSWRVIALTRADLDLTDHDAVTARFQADRPQQVIHCAALSRSPICEAQPDLAQQLNADVPARLAALAAGIPFVLLSSDLVFDGRAGGYTETAQPNPLSVYGRTKAVAESIVLRNPLHTVIRTSLNGGTSPTRDRGFNEEMRRAWQEGRTLRLFIDEFRNPIPAVVTARAIWELMAAPSPGVYHIAGSQRLSRWDMGRLIAARWPQLQPRIEPGSLRDYHGAPRPPDTTLDCGRAQARLTFSLPGLEPWLAEHPEVEF
jgi:dTDP-4-dehydrorhamnose reductase